MINIIKTIAIGSCFIFSFTQSFSQGGYGYYNDAVTFNQSRFGGSARTQGMGGVQIGLGGDVSNILSNPAGLGFFNRSEISLSPSLRFFNNSTEYSGRTAEAFGTRFSLDNISIVFNKSKDVVTEGDWRGGSFGISYNKINNFNNEFQYSAVNPGTSIIDYFLEAAGGIPANEFDSNLDTDNIDLLDLAYEHSLILPETDDNGNIIRGSYVPLTLDYPNLQSESVMTRGASSQWSFSYGGNYADRVYFGAGLGVASINHRTQKNYREQYQGDGLKDFDFTENNIISGIGINATFGVIVKPVEVLRVGASIITPTFYGLEETRESKMNSNFVDVDENNNPVSDPYSSVSSVISSVYSLRTPMRLNGGIAYFFNKNGFISADVQYLNFMSNKLSSREFSMAEDNQAIKDIYNPTINFRLGGEYRYQIFRFRAGAGYYGDPYVHQTEADRSRLSLSLGAGVRLPTFYVDLAVVKDSYNTLYRPYETTISEVPTAVTANNDINGVVTVGFNF